MSMNFFKKLIVPGNRGFTIVETLVAIGIILIALVGPFMEVERALTASYVARDELIANSLAQEGVEYVQGVRDNNYLWNINHVSPVINFLGGLDGTRNGANRTADCFNNNCTVDILVPAAGIPVVQCSGTCPPMSLSAAGYSQRVGAGQTPSRFTRSINLCWMEYSGMTYTGCSSSGPVSNEAKLTVTVTWSTEQIPYTTTVTEYIQNWL